MKKFISFLLAAIFLIPTLTVSADTPYQGYTYNFWGTLVPSPAAYVPVRSFGIDELRCGTACGLHSGNACTLDTHIALGGLSTPTDLHVDSRDNLYIVDSGNNRIIVFDIELNLVHVIDGYYQNGEWVENALKTPGGVFVTDDGFIYIADEYNYRILILDEDLNYVRQIDAPESDELADDFEFLPFQVLVDRGGRVFAIVRRVYEGIMSFDMEGNFLGYYGTINVSVNMVDYMWSLIMPRRQRNSVLPREFKSMDIDQYGFVFTTHVENWHLNNQISRLNPRGEDVLVNLNDNVVINGDQGWRDTGQLSGHSVFSDVVARSHGRYSAICTIRGRVFTYDTEGNLLYVFGGPGTLQGMVNSPVSIEVMGEDIFVLDAQGRGRIVQYMPTEYGTLINDAIKMRYDGEEQYAVEKWRELVKLDENFALAWSGIGRSYLAAGDNETAMEYLSHGMDIRYYSVAFRRYRLDEMQGILPVILSGGLLLFVALTAINIFRKIKNKGATAE
ncbi:MAG: gluconolactonase [Defluviitaleaceae bacterium]|nr:gluconolactonase [Defluviitaleaceae bacterium]